jgi:hypothetical protein
MITIEQQKRGEELIMTLAQKAWESSTFKEQLISNPVSTIESVTGQKMLSGTKVLVEDQTDDSIIYLNIPKKIDVNSLELTDEQLEMVSGGEFVITGVMVGCFAAGLTTVGLGVAAYAYFTRKP